MIHKNVEKAEKAYEEDRDCSPHLAYAYNMLEDYFNEKGIDPKTYAV